MKKKITTAKFAVGIVIMFVCLWIYLLGSGMVFRAASSLFNPKAAIFIMSMVILLVEYFFIKLTVNKLLKLSMEDLGMPKVRFEPRWVAIGFVLPLVILGIYLLMPKETLAIDRGQDVLFYVAAAVVWNGIYPGFIEEMIFRGLFLRLFEMRFNRIAGILLPSISFAAIHLLNGEIDLPSKIMLLIGGTAVGVMFSLIALAGRSVWNSAIVHVLWDFFIIGIFSFTTTPGPSCLFAYHLTDTNIFITGGEFGIEPSLLSTIAYIIVAIVAYRELRQKQL